MLTGLALCGGTETGVAETCGTDTRVGGVGGGDGGGWLMASSSWLMMNDLKRKKRFLCDDFYDFAGSEIYGVASRRHAVFLFLFFFFPSLSPSL